MRSVSLVAWVSAFLVLGLGAPRVVRAETLADALKRQQELSKLVEAWITLVERDAREDDVDAYAKYQEEDFAKPRSKRVTADTLAKMLADPEAGAGLRQRAADELQKAAMGRDPDISPDKDKRNDLTKRKKFARSHLLDLIKTTDAKGADQLGRGLAFKLLQVWFPPASKDLSEVANYDPASSKEDTWNPAWRAFRDALNR
jgi:hypothetical protein